MSGLVASASFEPPGTGDFVFRCIGPSYRVFGQTFCFNFIILLIVLTTLIVIGLFFFAFRKPKVIPGKFQLLMELGVDFVRENIALPMLGPDASKYMPLLTTFFFFILIGNFFEVVPGFSLSASSRIALPLTLAMIAWITYNGAGIRKHGFFGYLRHTCIIPSAPGWLRYTLLMFIEFISNIIVRPITLTVRLWANFLAGHFLLAIFFVGTIFFLVDGPKTWILVPVSFSLGTVLVGFEIFVSALQAFIFAILSASYIGQALAEEH
ncbi:MAG TPA: F0F1 ATP synthase subunit A [Actinomycetota bacterium]|nr:F0F1 ATP synthase subunit A [Actinomycetota bacterium]